MFYNDEFLARKKGIPEETIIPFKLVSFSQDGAKVPGQHLFEQILSEIRDFRIDQTWAN